MGLWSVVVLVVVRWLSVLLLAGVRACVSCAVSAHCVAALPCWSVCRVKAGMREQRQNAYEPVVDVEADKIYAEQLALRRRAGQFGEAAELDGADSPPSERKKKLKKKKKKKSPAKGESRGGKQRRRSAPSGGADHVTPPRRSKPRPSVPAITGEGNNGGGLE